jgi:hypothetical protein
MFVVAIHPEERAVVIGPRDALLGRAVEARSINWLAEARAIERGRRRGKERPDHNMPSSTPNSIDSTIKAPSVANSWPMPCAKPEKIIRRPHSLTLDTPTF